MTFLFGFLSIFNRKKKKNANDAKKADQGCSNEREKISVAYLLGGFAMLLLSMIYGGLCLEKESMKIETSNLRLPSIRLEWEIWIKLRSRLSK